METKKCSKCKLEKSIKDFSKNKSTNDGLHTYCKKCISLYQKNYYSINRKNSTVKTKSSTFNKKDYNREYYRKKFKNDLFFKFKINIRSLVRNSFRRQNFTKNSKTFQILNCSFEELKNYLFENAKLRYPEFQEKDFLEKNKYHIDHIIPLSTANTEEEVVKLCHYTNLQLLTKEENLLKSNH